MADLGVEPVKGTMFLATGGDFVWNYRYEKDGAPTEFPSGAALDLIIGSDLYPFTISGDTASIKIESEDADDIPDRTGFRLRLSEPTSPESTETILVYGSVKRIEPR